MGQAAVDLPDPMEQPTLSADAPSADDLLAQLAGDEIDRLLAEAEVERIDENQSSLSPESITTQPASPLSSPSVVEEVSASSVSAVEQVAPADEMPLDAGAAAAPEGAGLSLIPEGLDEETAKQLDSLFDELNSDEALAGVADVIPSAKPPPAAPVVPAKAAEELVAKPLAVPVAPVSATVEQPAAKPPAGEVDANQTFAAALDTLFEELVSQPVPPVRAPTNIVATAAPTMARHVPAVPVRSTPELDAQLEDLFKTLSVPLPEEKVLAATLASAKPPPVDPAGQTSSLERQVLAADLGQAEAEQAEIREAVDEDDQRVPFYLKPLLWLNSPLMGCSEATREILARVAIVTLVNALAVLAYVVVFRRH